MNEEEKLIDFFKKRKEVRLAYLFGSASKKERGPLSDIDVGVLLDKSLDRKARFKLRVELISRISSILETNKIDLVIMNQAPLSLSYNIIKYGKILKCDESEKIKTESRILSMYLDRKYFFDRHTKEALRRVSKVRLYQK